MAVVDGVIAAFDDDALAVRGRENVDLDGGYVVPGFHDGHLHPLWGGVDLTGAPVQGAATVDELLARVRTYAAEHPELPWITGGGYAPNLLPDGNGDAAVLDTAVADRPVLLFAADYHTGWANSAALATAGIDASTPDPPRGTIVRRADGSPLGSLLEAAADLVAAHAPPRDAGGRGGRAARRAGADGRERDHLGPGGRPRTRGRSRVPRGRCCGRPHEPHQHRAARRPRAVAVAAARVPDAPREARDRPRDRPNGEVLRRRGHRGGHRRAARALRRRAPLVRPAELGARGTGRGRRLVRRRRLPDPHPRHRRRRHPRRARRHRVRYDARTAGATAGP